MAQISIALDYDGPDDGASIARVLDGIAEAVHKVVDTEPGFGVQVDGIHRDPDDPATGLFE